MCRHFRVDRLAESAGRFHEKVVTYPGGHVGLLLTTEWVLVELADALSAPSARATAAAFLTAVRVDAQFEIMGYSRPVFDAGFALFSGRPDKGWSLTDCISFGVMAKRNLTDALTADQHFIQAAFRAVFR